MVHWNTREKSTAGRGLVGTAVCSLWLAGIVATVTAPRSASAQRPVPEPAGAVKRAARADEVMRLLTGRFDSSRQAAADPRYFAIQLEACRVRAPALGERVLYVEQATMDSPARPYRQRLYVIEPLADGRVQSRVFTTTQAEQLIGLCRTGSEPAVAESAAQERVGCAVVMERDGKQYRGGTVGQGCSSERGGAAYATSEVVLGSARLETWDRGFDAKGTQVWGAQAGPYIFDRAK
jgi:hypothetical protein